MRTPQSQTRVTRLHLPPPTALRHSPSFGLRHHPPFLQLPNSTAMQFVLTFISALLAAIFVNATPVSYGVDVSADAKVGASLFRRGGSSGGAGSCNAGANYCCNSVTNASNADESTTGILNAIGVDLSDTLNNVGLGCTSLVGGASCSTNALCCENNTFSGLIAVGCTPISLDA
ncbi:hydrophobin-domain-containing protein [Daedalea quercina L-15889]|uniref:Hydrophobin n=1 Tax=Daedalea quercina L-15889 TaxID=1314783 RepID=A0A165NY92_9APHY|nr:hydrophobin-domain-containing protein [Daedalea quercina L-15889]